MANLDDLTLDEIFELDARERIKNLNHLFIEIEKNPTHFALFEDAMRDAHSIKAAARVTNKQDVQNISHHLESVLLAIKEKKAGVSRATMNFLLKTLDLLSEVVNASIEGTAHKYDLDAHYQGLDALKNSIMRGEAESEEKKDMSKSNENEKDKEKTDPPIAGGSLSPTSPEPAQTSSKADKPLELHDPGISRNLAVRLSSVRMEKLLNLSSELHSQALHLKDTAMFGRVIDSFKRHDIGSLSAGAIMFQEEFTEMVRTFQETVARFEYNTLQIKDELMASRLIPIGQLFDPFVRLVRDLAMEAGKKINLILAGDKTQIDRGVSEQLKDPLTHLIRNACDHGIETPARRLKLAKSETGTLNLSAEQRGDRIIIGLSDDGQGIDTEKVRNHLVEKGLVSDEEAKALSQKNLTDSLFLPGFSTRDSVSTVSGRGFGLDIVKTKLTAIGGTIGLESIPGRGTRIFLSIPLTMAVTPCLLVEAGNHTFGIPLTHVSEVAAASPQDFASAGGYPTVQIRDQVLPVTFASGYWNSPTELPDTEGVKKQLVILGSGQGIRALCVDRLIGTRDVVNKPLDPRLSHRKDVTGGTILHDGKVACIMDPDFLLQSSGEHHPSQVNTTRVQDNSGRKEKPEKKHRILIVEDSMTVRELEKKALEKAGYFVMTATDGLDGYNKAREYTFDLIITDIEMPHMDGFEFISMIRKVERLRDIPTIIVSYRESDEDKRRGLQAGADHYLFKSQYDNANLVRVVNNYLWTDNDQNFNSQ